MNQYEVSQNVKAAEAKYKRLDKRLKSLDRQLDMSFGLTALLYFAFTMSLYVGDIWHIRQIMESFANSAAIAMTMFGVIALLMALVLASSKHSSYKHYSESKKGTPITIALFMAMGLIAEVFNSSGVQDVKARYNAESSSEYQSLSQQSAGGNLRIDTNLAGQVAAAKRKYEQCEQRLKRGIGTHCEGDKGNWLSLYNSQQQLLNAQVSASTQTQQDRFNRLDAIKEDGYNPVIKSVASVINVKISTAVAIVMFVFSAFFEFIHYHISVIRREVFKMLGVAEGELLAAKIQYFNTTGQDYDGVSSSVPTTETVKQKPKQTNHGYSVAPHTLPQVGATSTKHAVKSESSFGFMGNLNQNPHPPSVPYRKNSESDTQKADTETSDTELYAQFVSVAKQGAFRGAKSDFTIRECRDWIKERTGLSNHKAQTKAQAWLDKAGNAGEFKKNPHYTEGGRISKWSIK